MKKLILSVAVLLISGFTFGQQVTVTPTKMSVNNDNQDAFSIEIPTTTIDIAKKTLKSFMKDYHAKVSEKKGVYFADNAQIKSVSDNAIDVYAMFEQKGENTILNVAFDLGGAFVKTSSASPQSEQINIFLNKLGNEIYKASIKDRYNSENDKLKELTKQASSLDSDSKDLLKDNKNYADKIKDNEKKIKDNDSKKEILNNQLKAQQTVVEGLKNTAKALGK